MYKKKSICKYSVEGRQEIHKNLQFDEYVLWVMEQLQYNYKSTESIEFMDNKIDVEHLNYIMKNPKPFSRKDFSQIRMIKYW
jgi:hypothetical protein